MDNSRSVPKIHVRYKRFQKEQRDIWESFCLIDFYAPKIKDAVRDDVFPQLEFDRIWNDDPKKLKKSDIYGALYSLSVKGNYRRTLLESVLTFEDYITDLIRIVYLDIPQKLLSGNNDQGAPENPKILRIIFESADKQEMIEKLVEERIRGMFYGNPLDVFLKDKARIEFGNYFKDHHSGHLDIIKKAIAVRNIIAHNNGVIDRKFVREADPQAKIGQKYALNREFLKDSIYTLSLIAAHSSRLVVENIYKEVPQGKLGQALQIFRKNAN